MISVTHLQGKLLCNKVMMSSTPSSASSSQFSASHPHSYFFGGQNHQQGSHEKDLRRFLHLSSLVLRVKSDHLNKPNLKLRPFYILSIYQVRHLQRQQNQQQQQQQQVLLPQHRRQNHHLHHHHQRQSKAHGKNLLYTLVSKLGTCLVKQNTCYTTTYEGRMQQDFQLLVITHFSSSSFAPFPSYVVTSYSFYCL